jgi:hypothetical protein
MQSKDLQPSQLKVGCFEKGIGSTCKREKRYNLIILIPLLQRGDFQIVKKQEIVEC